VTLPGSPVHVDPMAIDRIEWRIASDLGRKALIATPVAAVAVGIWRGFDAGLGVVLAVAIVVANLLLSAAVIGWTARTMPHALTGVALLSFVGRIVLITAMGVGIKALDIVDWPVFCITLVAAYFVLLVWELRSVSFSLASPGLKPRPGRS